LAEHRFVSASMSDLYELCRDQIYDDEDDEELLDFISDGEGEDFDTLEPPIHIDETFPTTIFICNVPKVDKVKYDKLLSVLGKLIDKYGENKKHMPLNTETNQTYGFVIVSYNTEESAANAYITLNGMSLDKTHTFKVVKMDEFDKITSRSETFRHTPTVSSFSRAHFRDWLSDKNTDGTLNCREMFLLRFQSETHINWHDPLASEPVLCYGGEREKRGGKIWCDDHVEWSPSGSYVATFHKQGIALWAGPDFEKQVRFAHEGPRSISFSPNEEYILTWNGSHAADNDENAIRIFRVLTGERMRTMRTPSLAPLGGEFPHILWSHDGRYFAECNDTTVFVRDTQTFELIQDELGRKRNLKYDGLSTFQWSPKDNIMAIWTLEKNNNPARLALVEIPSRRELTARARTQVEASMHWQSEGDYLCLLVTKMSKSKKKGASQLEIFRIREKNIPVESVEIQDTVKGFFWESRGHRFAVLTTDDTGHKPKMLFYALGNSKCENVVTFDLPSNSFSHVIWAPDGQYFVVAAITGNGGDLLFGGLSPDNKLEILHKDEHFMLTDVKWDPSSRYVITSVTQQMRDNTPGFKYQMEAGYSIWTFQGRCLYKQLQEKLYHVDWRPHPPSTLSPQRLKAIRKDIKQYSKKYDALDEQRKESVRQKFRKEREEMTDAFMSVLGRLNDYYEDRMSENGWAQAWEDYHGAQDWEQNETIMEEELDVSEELISG